METKIITQILDGAGLNRAVDRISNEIIEKWSEKEELVVIGMRTRGVYIAERILERLKKSGKFELESGTLDVTFYRDDFRIRLKQPNVQVTDIPFSLDEKDIILVDDVLFTGRTVRSALNALMDLGRPSHIDLVVLVDRGHRELPIQPNFTGIISKTDPQEEIRVRIEDVDGEDAVYIVEAPK